MLTTISSVVYSTVCAGSSTTFLSPPTTPCEEEGNDDEQKDEEGPVKYSYAFFHMSFTLPSMYSAMLFTRWSSSKKNNEKLIDVGWASVWTSVLGRFSVLTTLIFSTTVMSCITEILATVKDLLDVERDRVYGIKSLSISLGRKRVFWTCIYTTFHVLCCYGGGSYFFICLDQRRNH
eukprot:Gb_26490 [translate_table: standard]